MSNLLSTSLRLLDSHNDGSQLGEMHHFTDGETEAWDGEVSSEKLQD